MYDSLVYINDFDIADESFNISKSKLVAHIENFFTRAIELLRRLVINLKRLKKFVVPKYVDERIKYLTSQLDDVYDKVNMEASRDELVALTKQFSDIVSSEDYLHVISSERDDYNTSDLISVNINQAIERINITSKMLVEHKTTLRNMVAKNDTDDHTMAVKLDIGIASHLMKLYYRYFAYGVEKKEKPVKGLVPLDKPIEVELVMR